jgi:hypothetical protein
MSSCIENETHVSRIMQTQASLILRIKNVRLNLIALLFPIKAVLFDKAARF